MKLKKIIINGKIIYTLKEEYEGKKTQNAHYKFVKIRSVRGQRESEEYKHTKD